MGREGEREGEKHQCVDASHAPPTGDLACNPGMCPRLGIKLSTLMACRPSLNPLSHTSQGIVLCFYFHFTKQKISQGRVTT